MASSANFSRSKYAPKTSNSMRGDKGVRRGARRAGGPTARSMSPGPAPYTSGNRVKATDRKGRAKGTRATRAGYKGPRSSRSRQKSVLTRNH